MHGLRFTVSSSSEGASRWSSSGRWMQLAIWYHVSMEGADLPCCVARTKERKKVTRQGDRRQGTMNESRRWFNEARSRALT